MLCPVCGREENENVWVCPECGASIKGGVVFVTGITGSDVNRILGEVAKLAEEHKHAVMVHDVGELMRCQAKQSRTLIEWDRILDASPKVLRLLRALAFADIENKIKQHPTHLHIVDLHLSFRWYAYLTPGFEPYLIRGFIPYVRLLINVVQDLDRIQRYLEGTAWGRRNILELLMWRDEERLLTDIYAGICGGVRSFTVAAAEPPSTIEQLIWHPDVKRVYLSFPMTAIKNDKEANKEIRTFRDRLREFVVVFDPASCEDYDKTYQRPDMKIIKKEVGQATIERDFRYIDQTDAIVVYYPKRVDSQGVDAEMRHAFESGKPVYLYCPDELRYGPFQPPADHTSMDREGYLKLLRRKLGAEKGGEKC